MVAPEIALTVPLSALPLPSFTTDNVLSDTEIAILDTSLNVEYLVCLSDLNI